MECNTATTTKGIITTTRRHNAWQSYFFNNTQSENCCHLWRMCVNTHTHTRMWQHLCLHVCMYVRVCCCCRHWLLALCGNLLSEALVHKHATTKCLSPPHPIVGGDRVACDDVVFFFLLLLFHYFIHHMHSIIHNFVPNKLLLLWLLLL